MNKQEQHEAAKAEIVSLKEVRADFQSVVDVFKQLPKGQYKKIWENETLKEIWERYGVI